LVATVTLPPQCYKNLIQLFDTDGGILAQMFFFVKN
jgi:hypothetical protein